MRMIGLAYFIALRKTNKSILRIYLLIKTTKINKNTSSFLANEKADIPTFFQGYPLPALLLGIVGPYFLKAPILVVRPWHM